MQHTSQPQNRRASLPDLNSRKALAMETFSQGRYHFAEGLYAQILVSAPSDTEALYMRGLSAAMDVSPDRICAASWLAALETFLAQSQDPAATKKRIIADANLFLEQAGNCLVNEKTRRRPGDGEYLSDYIRGLIYLARTAWELLSSFDLVPGPEDKPGKWDYLRFLHNALVACDNIFAQKSHISPEQHRQVLAYANQFREWKDAVREMPQESRPPKKRWWHR